MKVSSTTGINELLEAHPFLVEYLVGYSPRYGLLKNKVMRATLGKRATLKQVAAVGNLPAETLVDDIVAEIARHTGEGAAPEVEETSPSPPDEDRVAELRAIIVGLHRGVPFDEVKARFDELIADVEPAEIAAMEEQLIQEGIPVEEVQRLADLHVSVFKGALDAQEIPQAPPGHPVHTFVEENAILSNVVADFELLLQQLQIDSAPERFGELSNALQEELNRLARIEVHYQRKENQLFPYLEAHGIVAPPQVMWGADDRIRATLKQTREAFERRDPEALLADGKACAQAIADMVYKENHILFPLSLDLLDESEWVDIRAGESDIGYAFAAPAVEWPGAAVEGEVSVDAVQGAQDADQIDLDTGRLSIDQVNLVLKHLPVDLTFVDTEDRVRYFSAGAERIFPRSRGIIGRHVQNCHPPKSLAVVNRIVDQFRAGTRDQAAFWIRVQGRLIYIRYFAVRDDDEAFQGTLEVSQDITDIMTIEGEQRLLDWDLD